MSHVVSFPGLGWEFHFSSVAFSIGSKPIYWYGIVIVVGVLLAVLYASVRAPQYDLTADNIQDMILIVLPVSIICARLYYVAFQWDMYRDNPAEIIAIWYDMDFLSGQKVARHGYAGRDRQCGCNRTGMRQMGKFLQL